ncbi:MAG: 50S ribosomal protein L30e [Candidatus Diapherotrites archaeon]
MAAKAKKKSTAKSRARGKAVKGAPAVDANREIRRAVDTGKVLFGQRECEKSILKGEGQLVIIGSNTPANARGKLELQANVSAIPVHGFSGTAAELGAVCGKPFVVSVMLIKDAGRSKVLGLGKN